MTARYETLAKWANEFGWTLGAELGVSDGRTLIYLLEHCPKLSMLGVDIWDSRGTVQGPTASKEVCTCRYCLETREAKRNVSIAEREMMALQARHRFAERVFLHKTTTVEAANHMADGSLDFVFIDASHAENDVAADIAAWKSKVKPGGRVIGHDINMASVRAGVFAHFEERRIGRADDHVWFVDV